MRINLKVALSALLLLVVDGAIANAATVTPLSPLFPTTNFTTAGQGSVYSFGVEGTGSFQQDYAFTLANTFDFTVGENNSGATVSTGTLSVFQVGNPIALVSAIIAPPGASGQAATISDFLLGPGSYFFRVAGTATGDAVFGGTAAVDVAAAVPEASTWAMMLLGFATIGFGAYRRRGLRVRLAPSA